MRPTSIAAFQEESDSGQLSKMRRAVFDLLRENGPMTGNEVNAALRSASGHKRLSELERGGFVHSNNLRPCRITGREAIAWTLTGKGNADSSLGTSGVPTPGRKRIAEAVRQIQRLIELRSNADRAYVASDDLMETLKWLRKKGGER